MEECDLDVEVESAIVIFKGEQAMDDLKCL